VSATVNGQVIDEAMATGAVVAGRGTFEPAGGWGGDHHDGVPIFILSRRAPRDPPRPGAARPGRRLFDNMAAEHIELERVRVLQGESGVTHMRYRVRR
jgi:hypothetical protein